MQAVEGRAGVLVPGRLGGADESRRALIQQHLYASWGLKTGLVLKWWGEQV